MGFFSSSKTGAKTRTRSKLSKSRPLSDDSPSPTFILTTRQGEVDPEKAARIFGDKYKSLMQLKKSLRTTEAFEGLDAFTERSRVLSDRIAAALPTLDRISSERVDSARGLQEQIAATRDMFTGLRSSMEDATDECNKTLLLRDPEGSAAGAERAAIGAWLEENDGDLGEWQKLVDWRAELEEASGRTVPRTIQVAFKRLLDDAGVEGRARAVSDYETDVNGENLVSEMAFDWLEAAAPKTWLGSSAATINNSVCAVASTVKNVLQSLGARYVPTLDVLDILWPNHEPCNWGSVSGQIQTRRRIPEEWGWMPPNVTIDLDDITSTIDLVRSFREAQVTREQMREYRKEGYEWRRKGTGSRREETGNSRRRRRSARE